MHPALTVLLLALSCSAGMSADAGETGILEALVDELAASPARRQEARKRLAAIGPEASPALITRIGDESQVLRWEIVTVLGMSRDPAGLEPLAHRVALDPDSHVRWRAIWAIQSHPDGSRSKAARVLQTHLAGGNDSMRWNAAVGLAAMGLSDGLALLHAGLEGRDEWRRWEAIHSLGTVQDESSIARLGRILSSVLESERSEAVQSLGRIRGEESTTLLLRALADPAPGVRGRACRWLSERGGPQVVAALRELLSTESDDFVRRQAESALEKLSAGP